MHVFVVDRSSTLNQGRQQEGHHFPLDDFNFAKLIMMILLKQTVYKTMNCAVKIRLSKFSTSLMTLSPLGFSNRKSPMTDTSPG